MTDEEKETHKKTWETTQGYLKINDISKNNNELSKDEEEFLRSLRANKRSNAYQLQKVQ